MAIKTYHDVFVEQLIRRERPGGEFLFKCGIVRWNPKAKNMHFTSLCPC